VAVRAGGCILQIDGRTAFGAIDLPHLRPDFGQFRRGQATDELLFPQKLHEWRKASIATLTAEIRKAP
jgi:hypothetical protein